MILKISGVIRTDNLKAVLLFDADLNFSNKLYFGSIFMKRAEISVFLLQEQHGRGSGYT